MLSHLIFRRVLAALGFISALSGTLVAHAAPMTLSHSTSFQVSTEVRQALSTDPLQATTSSNSLTNQSTYSLQAFDSSLGTLTGVQMSFAASWGYRAEGTAIGDDYECDWLGNCTGMPSDAQMSGVAVGVYTLGLTDPIGAPQVFSSNQAMNCATSGIGYRSCTFQGSGSGRNSGMLDVSSIPLTQFLADANDMSIDFLVSNRQTASITSCTFNDRFDLCRAYALGGFSGSLSVVYQYDTLATTQGSVPEPGSLGLVFVAGTIGFLTLRRRSPKGGRVQGETRPRI